ncbi:oxidoreductase [Arthrobacter monumenti]
MATPAAIQTAWTASRMPNLAGKTIIITGGNSGIGFEAARAFAAHDAHVVLAVRDELRGREASAAISGSTEVRHLDLADLASIRAFAAGWRGDVHALINNAGVLTPPFGRTKDGFELQFGTNHLGHFALTNLLLPQITGRVVTVASGAHRTGTIDFDDLNWTHRRYRRGAAYSQSKLANLLFTFELQRRLEASGSAVVASSAHPGMAATNLGSSSKSIPLNTLAWIANTFFAQDAAAGAAPTLYAATERIPGGSYVGPGNRHEMVGPPKLVNPSDAVSNPVTATRLWVVSETLTGTVYLL